MHDRRRGEEAGHRPERDEAVRVELGVGDEQPDREDAGGERASHRGREA